MSHTWEQRANYMMAERDALKTERDQLRVAARAADYLLNPNQGERPSPSMASNVLRYALGSNELNGPTLHVVEDLLADPFFRR